MSISPHLNVAEPERSARLRALRMATQLLIGPRGTDLQRALADAEHDGGALSRVDRLFDALGTKDRRHLIASWMRTLPLGE